MKKIIIVPLLCALFLPSCNQNKNTYTITIDEIEHFNPSKKSLTFTADDFSPIALSYTTDEGYIVRDAKADLDSAECLVDYQNEGEIYIIPHENANFHVSVSMIRFSDASIVRIVSDDHFRAKPNRVVFKKGDYTPIEIKYEIDEYCTISQIRVENSMAKCVHNPINRTLIITPNADGEIHIQVFVNTNYKVIYFYPGDDATRSPEAKESILIPYGRTWGEFVDRTQQTATYRNFAFKGWSFEKGGYGEVINDDYVINKDTKSVVYGVYQHKINLISNSLEVSGETYADGYLNINLRIKEPSQYALPLKENITVISDGFPIVFIYQPEASNVTATIKIKNDHDIECGEVDIEANGIQPEYDVAFSLDEDAHLTATGASTTLRGNDYSFKLSVASAANDNYIVPKKIEATLKVGDEKTVLSPSAYRIEPDTFSQNANITIFGRYVKGDLSIKAKADKVNAYYYEVTAYGTEIKLSTESQYHPYINGAEMLDRTVPILIDINQKSGSEITGNNIAVKIDQGINQGWYYINDVPESYKTGIKFDESAHQIYIETFGPSENLRSLSFHVFHPQYNIFQKASWEQLDELASLPDVYIPRLFEIGQERGPITINNMNYTLRIIGFNHDQLTDKDDEAGLTVEFKELITNSDGKAYEGPIDRHGAKYGGREYDKYLNDTFFNSLPIAMQNVIKTVNKKYLHDETIETAKQHIFPLSVTELGQEAPTITTKEGSTYEFYKSGKDSLAKKHSCTSSSALSYWTRSMNKNYPGTGGYISTSGEFQFDPSSDYYRYMAAFCI